MFWICLNDICSTQWNLQEEQIGDQYYYTVGLKNQGNQSSRRNYARDLLEYETRDDGIQTVSYEQNVCQPGEPDNTSRKFDVVYNNRDNNRDNMDSIQKVKSKNGKAKQNSSSKHHEIIDKDILSSECSETSSSQFR